MGVLIAAFYGLLAATTWHNGSHGGAAFIALLGGVSGLIYYYRNRNRT